MIGQVRYHASRSGLADRKILACGTLKVLLNCELQEVSEQLATSEPVLMNYWQKSL